MEAIVVFKRVFMILSIAQEEYNCQGKWQGFFSCPAFENSHYERAKTFEMRVNASLWLVKEVTKPSFHVQATNILNPSRHIFFKWRKSSISISTALNFAPASQRTPLLRSLKASLLQYLAASLFRGFIIMLHGHFLSPSPSPDHHHTATSPHLPPLPQCLIVTPHYTTLYCNFIPYHTALKHSIPR